MQDRSTRERVSVNRSGEFRAYMEIAQDAVTIGNSLLFEGERGKAGQAFRVAIELYTDVADHYKESDDAINFQARILREQLLEKMGWL